MRDLKPLLSPPHTLAEVSFEKMLSAKSIAETFGVTQDTIMRWWHEGLPNGKAIPEKYVKRRGFRGYAFHPDIVAFIQKEQETLF